MFEILKTNKIDEAYFLRARKAYDLLLKRDDLGFFKVQEREHLWSSVHSFSQKKQFSNYIVVGIGGSALGTRAIAEALNCQKLFFLDNVDGQDFYQQLDAIPEIKESLFIFISKSGTTIETLTALEYIDQYLSEKSLSLNKQAVVITENRSSSLFDWAERHGIPRFEVPLDVGGRFSVLTPVGMLPTALAGLDTEAFRTGARSAILDEESIVKIVAEILASFDRANWITLFWFYGSRMGSFGAWLEQLWAESLAKKQNRAGLAAPRVSTPLWALGSIDQHSILQQVMEGSKDRFVIFQRIACAEGGREQLQKAQFSETQSLVGKRIGDLLAAEAIATEQAVSESGVPTVILKTKVLNEESLGYMFMFWMLVTGALGEDLQIDAFNQPGVEAGKKIAKKLLTAKS